MRDFRVSFIKIRRIMFYIRNFYKIITHQLKVDFLRIILLKVFFIIKTTHRIENMGQRLFIITKMVM